MFILLFHNIAYFIIVIKLVHCLYLESCAMPRLDAYDIDACIMYISADTY